MLAPVEAQPAHVPLDGLHIVDRFLVRVGVVEAQVADRVVLLGHAKIKADGLGVADVEEAVGLGRKTGDNGLMLAAGQVLGDDLADEVERFGGGFFFGCHGRVVRLPASGRDEQVIDMGKPGHHLLPA